MLLVWGGLAIWEIDLRHELLNSVAPRSAGSLIRSWPLCKGEAKGELVYGAQSTVLLKCCLLVRVSTGLMYNQDSDLFYSESWFVLFIGVIQSYYGVENRTVLIHVNRPPYKTLCGLEHKLNVLPYFHLRADKPLSNTWNVQFLM